MSGTRGNWESLEVRDSLSGSLGSFSLLVVLLDAFQEIRTRAGGLDVFDTDVDSLGKDLSPDTLVNNDSDGALSYVEDTSSLSVVNLVRHTLLEGSIRDNIDDVSTLVDLIVGRQMLNSVVSESLGEHVARSAPDTLGVGHC